jgi:hypothetical protein
MFAAKMVKPSQARVPESSRSAVQGPALLPALTPLQRVEPASSPGAGWNFGGISVFAPLQLDRLLEPLGPRPASLQPKLAIGSVHDPLEGEADRIAAQVMRMPETGPLRQATPGGAGLVQRKCAHCEEEESQHLQRKCAHCEEEEKIKHAQRMPASASAPVRSQASEQVQAALRTPGQPLPQAERLFFESRLGHDLSRVRIHFDRAGAESAASVNALAYTVGEHVVFGAGRYQPGTPAGRQLLAHELVHTIQQNGGRRSPTSARIEPQPTTRPVSWTGPKPGPQIAPQPAPRTVVPAPAARRSPAIARSPRQVARKPDDAPAPMIGYVAVYLGGGVSGPVIEFHSPKGVRQYDLKEVGDLTPGEYQAKVRNTGTEVKFTFDLAAGKLFHFSYDIKPGQPNPSTLFPPVGSVTFTVTNDPAPAPQDPNQKKPEPRDPNATYLSLQDALDKCNSGELKVKTFPFRGTRFGGAPLTVFRDGEDIVVKSYVYVLGNRDFRAQTRTLPEETFIGGVRLKPDEVVRVHTYEPKWYHLNITGSTDGDTENEYCVTGEQMLQVGAMSDRALIGNIALTVVDAATLFIPVGKLAGIIGKPVAQFVTRRGGAVAISAMLALREVAPTAFAGIASRSATVLVEEQAVDQVASRAVSKSVSQVIIHFAEAPATQAATGAAVEGATGAAASTAGQIAAHTVTVTVIDAAGHQVVSTLTTPTGNAAVDQMVEQAFAQTFNQAAGQATAAAAGQGVVSTAPEIAAGFTQAQVRAFGRILGKSFNTADIQVLQQLWDGAARAGDQQLLNATNARYLFDLQRNRFWRAVAGDPAARQLFTDAGCQFSGGAPYYMLNGRRIVITIDHILERQTAPQFALQASNLRLSFSRENSVVLRLLNQLSPF